jgi:hypothetical protein
VTLLKASDPPGRALKLPGFSSETVHPDRQRYPFKLPGAPADRPVDLTFGLYRTHTVEFLIQPRRGDFDRITGLRR